MQEKRRSKRIPIHLELSVSKLFNQEEIEHLDEKAPILVVDVSKLGIGFITTSDLPMNYYFNARLELGSPENALYCVVQIVRRQEREDGTISYGCEFVGMASVLYPIFENYEKMVSEEKEKKE